MRPSDESTLAHKQRHTRTQSWQNNVSRTTLFNYISNVRKDWRYFRSFLYLLVTRFPVSMTAPHIWTREEGTLMTTWVMSRGNAGCQRPNDCSGRLTAFLCEGEFEGMRQGEPLHSSRPPSTACLLLLLVFLEILRGDFFREKGEKRGR